VFPWDSLGQTDGGNQIWVESHINHSFANVYSLDNRIRYSINFESPKFRNLQLAPNLQMSLTPNVDVYVMLVMNYTRQDDTTSTFELRPVLGTQIHFTPTKRVLSSLKLGFEVRNVLDAESSEWQRSNRFRIRPQLIIPLLKPSYFEDESIYLITDVEWFITLDRDVHERYANRLRLRAGPGYRLSPQWRFEALYTWQRSRSTIGDPFERNDNILRINIRYYTGHNRSKNVD